MTSAPGSLPVPLLSLNNPYGTPAALFTVSVSPNMRIRDFVCYTLFPL